ncbi:MAG: hypothetical protein ACUVX1_01800 [Chloroflexota bacterium]
MAVEEIRDRWRIDDEWWRRPISRLYYQVIMKDGRMLTLFHDLVDSGWFMQSDTMPVSRPGNLRAFIGRSTQTRHSISSTRDVRRTALP